jgi:hypothetical protein
VAIRAPLKLIPHHPRFLAPGDQLFDVTSDPEEKRNLIAARPDAAHELRLLADEYEAGLRAPPPTAPGAALDPEEQEALRELGYLE